jgi:hypothetical protein
MDATDIEARIDRLRAAVVSDQSQRIFISSQKRCIFNLLHQEDDVVITRSYRAKFNRAFGGGSDINILKIELNIFEEQIAAAEVNDDQRQVQILKNRMEPIQKR